MNLSEGVRQKALELGFDFVGIAPTEPPGCEGAFRDSIGRGYGADMHWLARSASRRAR